MTGFEGEPITPGMRGHLDVLASGGHASFAAAAGIDFVYHNWASLIRDNADSSEDGFIGLIHVHDDFVGCLRAARKDVFAGVNALVRSRGHALPEALQSAISGLEDGSSLGRIAAGDCLRTLTAGWPAKVTAEGAGVMSLMAEYNAAVTAASASRGECARLLREAQEASPSPVHVR